MKNDLVIVFDFILRQWSFSPQTFKDAVINAGLAKFVLSVIWWALRFLVSKFPTSLTFSTLNRLLNTRPAKLIVLILDVTLIDVFLFFAVVTTVDMYHQFSYFSLWSAALFSFLLVYMFMITHADIKKY